MHEHIFVRDLELEKNARGLEWDRSAAVERAVSGLTALHALGVGAVVDLTVMGLGRDVELVAEVAQRVPVHLVAATGLYAAETLPLHFRFHGPGLLVDEPEPLVDLFVSDIEGGIGGGDVRAGMIKVMSEGAKLNEAEQRVMAAAAEAQQRTGVAITTHSLPRTRNGLEQQAFLCGHGVDPERLIIGHAGDSEDLGYLRAIMDEGSTVGVDRFGMEHAQRDQARLETVAALVRLGYADRLVLSHDAAFYSHATPPSWRARHAPRWHMEHLLRTIVPELQRRGVAVADIERMLITNPRRLLSSGRGGRTLTTTSSTILTGPGTC
jgi:phosphotriesterase-related protein